MIVNASLDTLASRLTRLALHVKLDPVRRGGAETEAHLVERSQAGDRAAFEELIRRHADRLYAVLLRFLGDPDDAAEASQEAFLRAWRSVGRFQNRSQFFTWLCRIGLNEAKRLGAKRAARSSVTSIEDEAVPEAPDWSEAPHSRLDQGELREVLERAVRGLPVEYRAPVILRDVEGLTTKQAAAIMGIREAAFKSRLHRARLAVRQAVDEYVLEGEQ